MSWPYPRIVAHRGGGALAPENTLGAIRLGASMGFKGVEFDVMLTADAMPIIIHDETLERTTNGREPRHSRVRRHRAVCRDVEPERAVVVHRRPVDDMCGGRVTEGVPFLAAADPA